MANGALGTVRRPFPAHPSPFPMERVTAGRFWSNWRLGSLKHEFMASTKAHQAVASILWTQGLVVSGFGNPF